MARTLANAWQGLTAVLGVGISAWALFALARASGPARRRRGPLLGATAFAGAAWAGWGVSMMLPSTVIAPAGQTAVILFVARGLAMTMLAAGLVQLTFNARQTLEAVRRLADRMAPFPGGGTLGTGLAAALADPQLRLVYALPGDAGFVQADGQLVEMAASSLPPDRLTEIRKDDELVAIAVRSSEAAGESVTPQFGAAVMLAADNERLLAAIRHDVRELRASRTRIVETGDAERRRLERNLHDGAQQRMLGIVGGLAIARDAADAAGDPRAAVLERAVVEADETIEALRTLARGIHPAILEEAGLAAALETLVDEAPLPVAIEEAPDARFNPASESAAWRLIARCVADAGRGGAASARVAVAATDGRLGIRVDIDGLSETIETISLEDVVGAAGGNLATSVPCPGTLRIQADLPCA